MMRAATTMSLTTAALFAVISTFAAAGASAAQRKTSGSSKESFGVANDFNKQACLISGNPMGIILLVMRTASEELKQRLSGHKLTPQQTSIILKTARTCRGPEVNANGIRITLPQAYNGPGQGWM